MLALLSTSSLGFARMKEELTSNEILDEVTIQITEGTAIIKKVFQTCQSTLKKVDHLMREVERKLNTLSYGIEVVDHRTIKITKDAIKLKRHTMVYRA